MSQKKKIKRKHRKEVRKLRSIEKKLSTKEKNNGKE